VYADRVPLPIDQPEPERELPRVAPGEARMCPVCGLMGTARVCDGCGVDVVTGELVHVPDAPAWRPDPSPTRRRRRGAKRSLPDLLRASAAESIRGWLGTVIAALWVAPLYAMEVRPLVAFLCAFVIAERGRGALGSPLVLLAPEAYEPGHEEEPNTEPLGPADLLAPVAKGAVTALLASPLLVWLLTPARISALQSAGFLGLAGSELGARVMALGTVFVTAVVVFLALRLSPGRRGLAQGDGTRPYDVLEVWASFPKAAFLMLLLMGLALQPLALLIAIPLLPLLTGALVSAWEDLSPPRLVHALRTTPRYLEVTLLSAPPLAVLALLLASEDVGIELAAPGLVVTSTLVGVLAGIARQDCEASQVDDDDDEAAPREQE
jgi:hypothetical protein